VADEDQGPETIDDGRGPVGSPKFAQGEGTVLSQCLLCSRLSPSSPGYCTAFPGGSGIPAEIRENLHDHRRPWIDPETGEPGDTGLAGDESIKFLARADVGVSAVATLFRELDALPRT
jgi:hypothetical protein